MVTIETISIVFTGISISLAAFYYINTLRNTRKNQELQLETRQAQLFMQIYQEMISPEIFRISNELTKMEWEDYNDFMNKYGGANNPDAFSKRYSTWYRLNGIGLLVKDEKTGATFAIMKAPKGVYIDQTPHCHPNANQFTFVLSGERESTDGTRSSFPDDVYNFGYCPKNVMHGSLSEGFKVHEDVIYLHYWDGPDNWGDRDGISGGAIGFKVNVEELEWKAFPEGWYLTDVQYHKLWKNKDTGAMFVLVKIPVGGTHELPHTHPQADQMGFGLTGKMVRDNGSETTAGEGNYVFGYRPQGTSHGPPLGSKVDVTEEVIIMQYFDGPPTKLNEGETTELILE